MSLLTSITEASPGDFFFAPKSASITQITGVNAIGTITNSTGTVSNVVSYTFKAGTYYVQAEIDINNLTVTAGDFIVVSIAQNGVLNPTQLTETYNPNGLANGTAGRLMVSGYINTVAGAGLKITASGTVGVSSGYQVVNPTGSKIFIQQIA